MSRRIYTVGPFLLGETIGRGSIGRVKLAVHKETGFKVAVKIIDKEKINEVNPHLLQKIEREIVLMKLLNHRNVLKLYEVYETSKYLFLILEYAEGGELFEYLVSRGGIPLEQSLDYFFQLITGLEYCHSRFIYHRDLKPENLLLSSNHKVLKIADFGLAAFEPNFDMCKTSCGSPHYASPEIIAGKKYDGSLNAIWSCGVILYSLVTGRLPFEDPNLAGLLSKIRKGTFSIPQYVPEGVRDLIERCIVTDPCKRITIPEILAHPCLAHIVKRYTSVEKPVIKEEKRKSSKTKKFKNLLTQAKVNSAKAKSSSKDAVEELPIKPMIVEQLQVLGWKEGEILKALKSSKQSMIKTVYGLIYEHEAVPPELIYSHAVDFKDELELDDQDNSSKRRSMSAGGDSLKRQTLLRSAPARVASGTVPTPLPSEPAGPSSVREIQSIPSNNEISDTELRKARRTMSDRSRQVVRVRVRSGSGVSDNSVPRDNPTPRDNSIPQSPTSVRVTPVRDENRDIPLPALVNAV